MNLNSGLMGASSIEEQDVVQNLASPLHAAIVQLKAGSGSSVTPTNNSVRREIGDLAVWSLSSAKSGNGVDQIRDNSITTFWQSDGQQPHFVNIQFLKRVRITELAIYLDFKTDESYTPQKISIRANNSFYELQEIKQVEFEEPSGWFVLPLHDGERDFIKTNMVQIGIL